MKIEEKANILLQDYRLRAENDYLNNLNDIYIERINKAIAYMEKNMIDREINCYRIDQIDVRKLLDILKGNIDYRKEEENE